MTKDDAPYGEDAPDFRRVRGMDPAANWLLEFGVGDFLPETPDRTLIPLLLELRDDAGRAAAEALLARPGVAVLGFGAANDAVRTGALLPVVATREFLRSLFDGSPEAEAFLASDKRVLLSSPVDVSFLSDDEPPDRKTYCIPGEPRPPIPGTGPIVAVIDDGVAFAHHRFSRPGGGTRVEAFWDMNRGFPYYKGVRRDLDRAAIEALIAGATAAGGLDEDAAYRRAGQLSFRDPRHKPLAWRASHGTHVLDLAAGAEPEEDGPAIVAVQLPSPVVARTTGELLDFYVWLGVLYALDRAGDRPLAINVSFGYDAGPHDGGGLLERHLSLLVEGRPRTAVVLPSGNAQLSRCHAVVDLAAREEVTLDWVVQPDDRTHSIIEVWLPPDPDQGERVRLRVTMPGGAAQPPLDEPAFPAPPGPLPLVALAHAGATVGLMEVWERPDGRRLMRLAIFPTARPQPDARPVAPAGVWSLRFERGTRPLRAPAHAWIQRDDSLYGYPQRGRQSYFDAQDYERFDALGFERDEDPPGAASPVVRASLMNAIATSAHVLSAGGYRVRDGRIARYSSGGPNVPPEGGGRLKPDALLPSEGSAAHPGMLAAGARSGARVAMDGTSVAAPQLARHVLALMDKGPVDRTVVAHRATTGGVGGPAAAPERAGHGRLRRLDADRIPSRFEPGD